MTKSPAGKAYILAILAVLFWSTSPTAFKLGLRFQDTYQLLTLASLTSFAVLGVILLSAGRFRHNARFGWKDFGFSAIMGLLNPVVYYLVLFRAYSILPAQVAQPLNMVWPIVLVLISIPVLKQKIGWKSIAAMLVSFSGVVLVSLQGGTAGRDPENLQGISLALFSSVLWAVYWILNSRDGKDPVVRLFLNFMFASIYLVIGGLTRGNLFPSNTEGWYTAIYVGIFEMGVTFVLWLLAMQHASSTDRISNLVYMAPFLNLFIVRMVLDERIYQTTIPGIVLLVAGILGQNLVMRHERKR